ncbi:MAG: NAD(P)-dependent oxidoreductase [Brevinema sp.]
MKIIIYAVRPDEQEAFKKFEAYFDCQMTYCSQAFSVETADLAKDHDSVIIIGNCKADRAALKKLWEYGILYFSTRTTGYNNIDLHAVKEFGMRVANVPAYSPNSVADFTVLSALSMIRNYPLMLERAKCQNYSLGGLIGKEIRNMTLGFIGVGRIGRRSAESFLGMNPKKILGYDPHPTEEGAKILSYVTLDTLLAESDLISFHINLNDNSYHLINNETIKTMKDGVFIINTSRGGVIDTEAALKALDSGKIAGLATDVYEHEVGILHANNEGKTYTDATFQKLHNHPKVIVSPHYAFYTDEAVSNMVEYSIQNLIDYKTRNTCSNEIVLPSLD